jgi:hypothetical protein
VSQRAQVKSAGNLCFSNGFWDLLSEICHDLAFVALGVRKMAVSEVSDGAQENPFNLNATNLSGPLPDAGQSAPVADTGGGGKALVTIPDALAALSEPSSGSDSGIKFANVTAGETLEMSNLDVDEDETGDKSADVEPVSEEIETKREEIETKQQENETTREEMQTEVATFAPVLDALPDEKQPEAPIALQSHELRQIVSSQSDSKVVAAPPEAVAAAAEIGLSQAAPKPVDNEQEPPVRKEISLFSGPNAKTYVEAWESFQSPVSSSGRRWSMPGFLFSIAWFAYRRLHVMAMIWLIALAAVSVYAPKFGVAILASAMICGGFCGKSLYARHADQMIRSKIKSASEPDEYIASIVRAGGVSLPMGIFVGVLTAGLIVGQGYL